MSIPRNRMAGPPIRMTGGDLIGTMKEIAGQRDRALTERDRLAAEVETLKAELKATGAFWLRCRKRWIETMCEVGPDEIQNWGEEYGLLVPTVYDPDKHGEVDDAEPGDTIYVNSELANKITAFLREANSTKGER